MKIKFKKVTTSKMAKLDPRVDDVFAEYGNIESGKYDWWINLKEGWICRTMGCGTIHEQTLKSCLQLLNTEVITEEQYNKENEDWLNRN
jgi:hypothetical protein